MITEIIAGMEVEAVFWGMVAFLTTAHITGEARKPIWLGYRSAEWLGEKL